LPLSANPICRTLIVADDLTGACDAAVAFASAGRRPRVLLKGELNAAIDADICALSTNSRDVPLDVAEAKLSAIASQAIGFSRVFKKIDSAFRGNTAREIALVARLFPARLSIVAPAYPALGRSSRRGIIRIRDVHGEKTVDALTALRSVGLEVSCIPACIPEHAIAEQLLASTRQGESSVVFCDAQEQPRLEAIVHAARRLPDRILWVGSGGLAHALAVADGISDAGASAIQPGLVLLFVGSNHEVTIAQVRRLFSRFDVATWRLGNPPPNDLAETGAALIPLACGQSEQSAIAALAAQIDPDAVSCLFMTGGDTAALLCDSLGIEALDLQREFEPGLPQGLAVGGRFSGCTIVLKSGGFGEAATLESVVRSFARCRKIRAD
jgi:D-threonate/D-erythronate kinase